MTDTIELLEAIGSDASLRRASTEELTTMLAQARASKSLTAAVAAGDSALLFGELGSKPCEPPQISQYPGHEDDEPEEGDQEEPSDTEAPSGGKSSLQA